ncbi:MAG TPA: superoxide dismutase [Fibrobacter sp.]|nr:superoxide dismutase [Fibrobacter sp.]
MTFKLPTLPFAYDALEPWYDEATVKIHHTKHHQAYTDNLNKAIADGNIEVSSIEDLLQNLDKVAMPLRTRVINHGGGFYNHNFFWESLAPVEKSTPSAFLKESIEKKWASFDAFKEEFSAKALAHFGSGWAWLVLNKNKELEIIDTHDQVCPLSLGYEPLLTLDVWEHAYYLKFENRRAEWIAAFWNIVNYGAIEDRLKKALTK